MKKTIIAGTIFTLAIFIAPKCVLAIETYAGDAYDLTSGELLYRETHYLSGSGDSRERVVLYRCAEDGRPFARKVLHDDGEPQSPNFDMVDARLGYREGVRRDGDGRVVYVQRGPDKPEQAEVLPKRDDSAIDAGFDIFVQRHWDVLVSGKTVSFPFLVPSRRTYYDFKVSKLENATSPANTLTIRLALGAWYAFLLPHIDVTYDRTTRRLLSYQGLSNIRKGDGKNYVARMEYPAIGHHTDVAQNEFDAALAAPLTDSCAVVRADTSASPAKP
jgi:hypothetical protein